MSIPLVINGVTFNYPSQFDTNWGPTLTSWSSAVTNGMLQKAGGAFTLTAETDFGGSFGLKSLYLKSRETNPASTGFLRLGNASAGIVWRNGLNNGDLVLTTDASNNLLFNGSPIGSAGTLTNTHILVGNVSNVPTDVAMSGDVHIANTGATTIQAGAVTGSKIASGTITESNITAGTITNTSVNASAAIAVSKLAALNAFITPVTDSSGFLTNSATTATELGYVHGVTSGIQSQINAITATGSFVSGMGMPFFGASVPSGWLLCDGSAVSRTTYSSLFGAIGTTYGVGDGSTTFNLPTGTNYTMVGKGGSIAATLGATSGATTHTLTTAELPANIPVTDSGHHHQLLGIPTTGGATAVALGDVNSKSVCGISQGTTQYYDVAPSGGGQFVQTSTTGVSVGGSGTAHSIVQPSLGINWIIKT